MGELSTSQKLGIITLIPKGNKCRHYLKNWRPISLLNVTYKLLSRCLANRLVKVLSKLIHTDQKGFLPNRFIGENIRVIYDLISYVRHEHIPSQLVLADFASAFDSLSHSYMQKVLSFFGIGPSFKKWVTILYENACSSVIVNNQMTNRFQIQRGVRQGDPLSPYLFILSVEIFALWVRSSPLFKGITVNEKEFRILQYADDTALFLDSESMTLQTALDMLEKFASYSGLELNCQKTQVICMYSYNIRTVDPGLGERVNLIKRDEYFHYLGTDFHVEIEKMPDYNYDRIFDKVKRQMISWSKRNITVLGRIVIVKSLLLSQFTYLFLSLPGPSEQLMKNINNAFFRFIWGNKPDKVSRHQMVGLYKEGGLKMVDIKIFHKALKLTWFRRFLKGGCENVEHLMNSFLKQPLHLSFLGDDYFLAKANETVNPFWKEMLTHLASLFQANYYSFLSHPLWKNSRIKIDKNSILLKSWSQKGILFVNDLVNEDGSLLSQTDCERKFNTSFNFLRYFSVCQAIKCAYKMELGQCSKHLHNPVVPSYIATLMSDKSGCSRIYKILLGNRDCTEKTASKWESVLQSQMSSELIGKYNCTIFRFSCDISLRYFQYKIMNGICYMNRHLFKMKISNSDLCSFCGKEQETLLHFFIECRYSKAIWEATQNWLSTAHSVPPFSKQNILLGFTEQRNDVLTLITVLIKQQLFICRCNNKFPVFSKIVKHITQYYNDEKYLYAINNNKEKFQKRWCLLETLFC